MQEGSQAIFERISQQLAQWSREGLPTREGFEAVAQNLLDWRRSAGLSGLWSSPPLLMTATLDDGWGHGLKLIHLFAEAAGLRVEPLGLLQSPARIVEACRARRPDFLGLTVLQFDSEEMLAEICRNIPVGTRTIVGGPIFQADPQLAERAGVDFVAPNAASFWQCLLDLAGRQSVPI